MRLRPEQSVPASRTDAMNWRAIKSPEDLAKVKAAGA